jgi:ATP-binding cassette subfamily E protein 1
LGKNGVGKTTLLKYLAKELNMTISYKPQNIDNILRNLQKKKSQKLVKDILNKYVKKDILFHKKIIESLDLHKIYDNKVIYLSGGEFQSLTCAVVLMQEADVYILDEPTTYLDIRHRLKLAELINSMSSNKYVILVDHDLMIAEYICDYIHIMYGSPGAYGAVSSLYSTSKAINIYYSGYSPADNMRFRKYEYSFKNTHVEDYIISDKITELKYKPTDIHYDNFNLRINGGNIASELIIILGKNGVGKTTLLKYLAKELNMTISYKPQHISIEQFKNNDIYPKVIDHLVSKVKFTSTYVSSILNPLRIPNIYDKYINNLSGGELQRLMIAICLGQDADIYLIDEPSASLDIEQRVLTSKVIKRYVSHNMKICFVVEHDIMMVMHMIMEKIKVIVFDKKKYDDKLYNVASTPMGISVGISKFLRELNITFRTDEISGRPRINKQKSIKDREQKQNNMYYK